MDKHYLILCYDEESDTWMLVVDTTDEDKAMEEFKTLKQGEPCLMIDTSRYVSFEGMVDIAGDS